MAFDMVEAMTLIAREKNIDFDTVVETLEQALLAAAKKKYNDTENITFRFDKKTNELLMIATKRVVEKVLDENIELTLEGAKEIDPEAELDDEIEIYIDYEYEFGRNAIASAKQILIQKVREAERDRIYEEYIDKVGTMVSGVVQQIDKGNLIVNLGRAEGLLPVKEQLSRERFRQGDRVRAQILDVQKNMRGPQIILSRVCNDFLNSLFELEVPEIFEKVIEIRAIAREPGERSKIAVYSSDERIDPVGACVGIKGVRVQSIVRELNNERIDIVPYSTNPEVFVTHALAPARVVHIEIEELEGRMTVAVEDEKLSLAIGRNGQNARLASKLTGWKVNIMSETEYEEQQSREADMLVPVGQLEGVGPKLTEKLIKADISSIQRLASTQVESLIKIEGLGQKTAETLIEKAQAMVEELEEEFEANREELEAQKVEEKHKSDKLSVDDMFKDEVADEDEDENSEETEEIDDSDESEETDESEKDK